MFQHSNRYEEVNKRIKLGKSVEGRDEKAIKKTICAFLKILHPLRKPTDEEFDEYVAYAVECRRRIKEQMNKRKPDEEFAGIDLSYVDALGQEIVVRCPESINAPATLSPTRRSINEKQPAPAKTVRTQPPLPSPPEASEPIMDAPSAPGATQKSEPIERHFTILYGDTGYSYESILGPYLEGVKEVTIEDPYIRAVHQIQNLVRVCETLTKLGTVKRISLITSYDDSTQLVELQEKLDDLKQSLLELDITLDVQLNPNLHDREIRLDNGWVVKIGRGLDFYQKPGSWYEVGALDLSLRKCLETKVDIFKQISAA
jgi:ATP-dependent Lon protease